ncbi:MAG: hypothetical protein ACLTL6_02945 [Holdemanella porci]
MNKTTKPNDAGSHKSIRMKGWPRGRYKKINKTSNKSLDQKRGHFTNVIKLRNDEPSRYYCLDGVFI